MLFICAERAFGAPQGGQNAVTEPIAIIRQESNIEPDGSYQYRWEMSGNHCKRHHFLSRWTANRANLHDFIHSLNGKQKLIEISTPRPNARRNGSYETANGIQADETGTLKKASSPDSSDVITAQGRAILQVLRRFVFEIDKNLI